MDALTMEEEKKEKIGVGTKLKRHVQKAVGTTVIVDSGKQIVHVFSTISPKRILSALRSAPRYDSIEEREEAWAIDDENRGKVIRVLKVDRLVSIFFMIIGATQVFSSSIFLAISSSLLIVFGLIRFLVTTWRIAVLAERNNSTFVEWLRGKSES